MDCRQVAFSFAIPRGPGSLTAAENNRGMRRRMRQGIYENYRFTCVSSRCDESVRESLPDLLREFGFAARAFSSPEEFLASDCVGPNQMSDPRHCHARNDRTRPSAGIEASSAEIPIIFVTAQRDEAARSRLLEQGAVECLFKPFSDTALLQALNVALRMS